MSELHTYGGLLLGSRLRRLSEMLYAGVDEVYRAHYVKVTSRAFPILMVLRDNGRALPIGEVAKLIGWSHVTVSRLSTVLARHSLTAEAGHARDRRRLMIHLMPKGDEILKRLEPVWRAIVAAVDEIGAEANVLSAVRRLEESLEQQGFAERVRAQLRRHEQVVIVPFRPEPQHRRAFQELNVEWLTRYFYVEEIDVEVLSHPEKLIADGGAVLLAECGDELVGTVALIRHPRGRYELSKMAVTERYQGRGIGHQLLRAAIRCFEELGGKQLFLETNHKLLPAIRLYEDNGFVRAERPKGPIHYVRSDVYMVFSRASTGASKRRRARRGSR